MYLITGATRGLGLSCAKHLLHVERQAVLIASRNAAAVEETVANLNSSSSKNTDGGDGNAASIVAAKGMVVDTSEPSSVRSLVERLQEQKIKLQGVVCATRALQRMRCKPTRWASK